MKPLQRATVLPKSEAHMREEAAAAGLPVDEYRRIFQDTVDRAEIWMNDVYQVAVHRDPGALVHISIKRIDQQPVTDWRHKQAIKNQLVGPECEAVELYPAESRMVDYANQFHLWAVPDPKFRFPIGWHQGRNVSSESAGRVVQRPLEEEP